MQNLSLLLPFNVQWTLSYEAILMVNGQYQRYVKQNEKSVNTLLDTL